MILIRKKGVNIRIYLDDAVNQSQEQLVGEGKQDDKDQTNSQIIETIEASSDPTGEFRKYIAKISAETFAMADFFKLVEAVNSSDRFQQHYGVIGLRKLLSDEMDPPIQPVIDANLVPRLIEFMKNEKEPHLQVFLNTYS